MTTTLLSPTAPHASCEALSETAPSAGGAVPAFLLALMLVLSGPQFVCLPLTNDTAYYDLQTKNVLEGGVLYRDMLEPNLPGVVWIHAAVRSVLGWRSETLRGVDFFLFGGSVCLLCLFAGSRLRLSQRLWMAVLLVLFYLSQSEWSHTQRDIWMLVPAAGGLAMRRRQMERLASTARPRLLAGFGFLEGLVWGLGVWIKPYVAIMGLACWLVSAIRIRRWKPVLADALGLLAGGLLVGAVGIGWLMQSGAWPYFLETVREWNPRYFAAGKEHWTAMRYLAMCYRFFPWILLHAAAVPYAVFWLGAGLRRRSEGDDRQLLLSAFYLAWMFQAYCLQHLFDYVHAPTIVLAVCVMGLAAGTPTPTARSVWKLALVGFSLLALICSPIFTSARLSAWPKCVTRGSTPEVRQRLARLSFPNWIDLENARMFLARQQLRDGELTCYNNDLVYLYEQLGVRPSTRYVYLESYLTFFPDHRKQILKEVVGSPQRFIVSDLQGSGMSVEAARRPGQAGPHSLPEGFPEPLKRVFPWNYPVVFRAGSILVHDARAPALRP